MRSKTDERHACAVCCSLCQVWHVQTEKDASDNQRSREKRRHVCAHDRMRADKRQSREAGQRIASAGNATDDPNRAGMRPETKRVVGRLAQQQTQRRIIWRGKKRCQRICQITQRGRRESEQKSSGQTVDDHGIAADQERARKQEHSRVDAALIDPRAQQDRAELMDARPAVEEISGERRLRRIIDDAGQRQRAVNAALIDGRRQSAKKNTYGQCANYQRSRRGVGPCQCRLRRRYILMAKHLGMACRCIDNCHFGITFDGQLRHSAVL